MIKVERAEAPIHITLTEAMAKRLTALLSIVQDNNMLELMNELDAEFPDEMFDQYYRALDDEGKDINFPEVVVRP